MLVLGLETSCDETAAALVHDGRHVRASVIASQAHLHAEYGGVVPELASRAHLERLTPTIRAALDHAAVTLDHVDAVAVTARPGLIGPLLVGVAAAKALAWSLNRPLVGVHHVHAHLAAGLLDPPPDRHEPDLFPALGLVVSGGHTALYRLDSPHAPALLGSTIDDALGEAYDKVATMLGLPYPGGPHLDRLASHPDARPDRYDLPISRLAAGSLDLSLSGLKTAALYALRGVPDRAGRFPRTLADVPDTDRRDLAAAFQRAAVAAIMLKLRRAFDAHPGVRALFVGGGVAANSRLRAQLPALTDSLGVRLILPPMKYCLDNAAMIAALGHDLLATGLRHGLELSPSPTGAD